MRRWREHAGRIALGPRSWKDQPLAHWNDRRTAAPARLVRIGRRNPAEGVGFEPTVAHHHDGFQDRSDKPLRHPSSHSARALRSRQSDMHSHYRSGPAHGQGDSRSRKSVVFETCRSGRTTGILTGSEDTGPSSRRTNRPAMLRTPTFRPKARLSTGSSGEKPAPTHTRQGFVRCLIG